MDKKIDQKTYLQKYLSGSSTKKKKRKKIKGNRFKIIDDDVDYTKLRSLDDEELDLLNLGEDAPQIAGIIDERPEEVRKLEQFKISSKWKVINQDDGLNSKIKVEEIKQTVKEKQKENELVFGKMYSDSEEEEKDAPRKNISKKDQNKIIKKMHNDSDSDVSPPRKSNKDTNSNGYNSDLSPPRKNRSESPKERKSHIFKKDNQKVITKKMNNDSDNSDISPPRKSHKPTDGYNSDLSPPRKNRSKSPKKRKSHISKKDKQNVITKKRHDDSDVSPPRKSYKRSNANGYNSDLSPPRKNRSRSPKKKKSRWETENKTLDGKAAGLQNASQLRDENVALRKREELAFTKMTDEISGRNAKAVSRKSKRETSEDRKLQKEKAERQKLLDEKYKVWNRGIKQIEAQEQRAKDFLHEASKPLARLRDDVDLERALKNEERDGDPMLDYIRDKRREAGDLPPERPIYKGNFPINRFNIRPGYRWDGVDRSNGYENKYFQHQSNRKAQEEEAYKWSSADL